MISCLGEETIVGNVAINPRRKIFIDTERIFQDAL
jgi:hypothetical protein